MRKSGYDTIFNKFITTKRNVFEINDSCFLFVSVESYYSICDQNKNVDIKFTSHDTFLE